MTQSVIALFAAFAVALSGRAAENDPRSVLESIRNLEREGKFQEAFNRALTLPGAEYYAQTIGRSDPETFLRVLRTNSPALQSPRSRLVEADLLMALGRREEAARIYSELSTSTATNHWGTDRDDYYPVEPPGEDGEGPAGLFLRWPAQSFACGPGSHRDNWLLRRLIALDKLDEAAREFARVWTLHRAATQPWMEISSGYSEGLSFTNEVRVLVRPFGFDACGLQFALDYAFFLKRRGDTNAVLAVLSEPLRLLDLDRNPNMRERWLVTNAPPNLPVRPANWHGATPMTGLVGVSREEFIRLAYGEFKSLGRDAELIQDLERRIAAGDNRARRILAQIRLHQGQTEAALALELDYLRVADFDERTTLYRRGLMFEEFQKATEAVADFEKLLALSPGPVSLPDPKEQVSERAQPMAAIAVDSHGWRPAPTTAWRADVQARLLRLYNATGQTDKALELELARFSESEDLLRNLTDVQNTAARFRSARQEPRFTDWAQARLSQARNPITRANLAWVLKEYSVAAQNIAQAVKAGQFYDLNAWKDRFRQLGRDNLRALLAEIVEINPRDAVSRLELLDLEDRLDGPEAIETLEFLLREDAAEAFPRWKGSWNRTRFGGYFDLGYRLARLYEKNRQWDKLQSLAIRIARGDKPFKDTSAQDARPWELGVFEYANAALAVAVQHADTSAQQDELAAALNDSRWQGARAQLERRRRGNASTNSASPPAAWVAVPQGVELFASLENVLSLAKNDEFIFAGHPWGVAVYDLHGKLVTRLPLGEAVRALAAGGTEAWAGTPKGLFRIRHATNGWSIAHQPLDNDVPSQNRYERAFPGAASYWFDNGVYALALDNDELWIGLHRNVQMLNTRSLELRAFSFAELKISSWAGFNRFVVERDYVWADSPHAGLRRYDRKTQTWDAPAAPSQGVVRLIGVIDGELWGHAWVNETLRDRPCLIDRRTLKVTPILIAAGLPRDQQMINGPFMWLGRHRGHLMFGDGNLIFEYDPIAKILRPVDPTDDETRKAIKDGPRDELVLADGTRVFGRSIPRSPRYEYPGEDEPLDVNVDEAAGGLFFVAVNGATNRVSSTPHVDSLPGDNLLQVVFDEESAWLCTSCGLARLNGENHVTSWFTRTNGLLANNVRDGTKLGDKFYFATGWGQSAGGLIVFDPATRVFTSFHRSDGMDADKLKELSATATNQLQVIYDIDFLGPWQPGEKNYRRCPPGLFDPVSNRFTSRGPPQLLTHGEVQAQPAPKRDPMPFLGGWVLRRLEHDGKILLCGTRGMVILRGDVPPTAFTPLGARVIIDPANSLLGEARRLPIPQPISPEQLKTFLAHTNGYVRANAVAAAMTPVLQGRTDLLPAVSPAVSDPFLNVRSTAVWLFSRGPTNAAVLSALRQAIDDPEPGIRAVAALALANRGEVPSLSIFEEIIQRNYSFGNYPFGAESTVGIEVDAERTYAALAPHADEAIFALMIQHPLPVDDYAPRVKIYTTLGESLRRRPQGARVLLEAHGRDEKNHWQREPFAQTVFKYAGRDMLPILHASLKSTNRVVRSNAGRGCGAINDPSSIPFLLQALDMESGLARASIVWALGELKAKEALPRLVELYSDARNQAQNSRGRAGYLAQQASAATRAQYRSLRNLEAIAGDWNELRLSTPTRRDDPGSDHGFDPDEDLLTAEHVLAAVRKIGPEVAQSFYRALAGAKDSGDRREAATGLAAGAGEDLPKNLEILRNLSHDADAGVRARALVSLLLLNEPRVDLAIREGLGEAGSPARAPLLDQLNRLSSDQLSAFRKELDRIAVNEFEPSYLGTKAQSLLERLPVSGAKQ